jgi:hypothetical protein
MRRETPRGYNVYLSVHCSRHQSHQNTAANLMAARCATSKNWRNQTGTTGAAPLARARLHPHGWPFLRLGGHRANHPVTCHMVTCRALPRRCTIGQFLRMNELATIEHEPKPAKARVVSRRVRHCIDLIVSGQCKTQKEAAEKAGLTRERLCRALKESHVQEYLAVQTRVLLSQSQAPAAATLMKLLEQAKSEHVRKEFAVTLLGYSGIHATGDRGPIVSINMAPAGYVVRLRHLEHNDVTDGAQRIIDVTPETAE